MAEKITCGQCADPTTVDERIGDDIRDALDDLAGPLGRIGRFIHAWRDQVAAAPLPPIRLPPTRQVRVARIRLACRHLRLAARLLRAALCCHP